MLPRPGFVVSFLFVLAACWPAGPFVAAEERTLPPEVAARPVITHPNGIWSLPREQWRLEFPVRIEARVNFVDLMWRNLWLEQPDVRYHLPLGDPPPQLRTGQRVLIEGTMIPAEGLQADLVRVTVLREFEPIEPVPTAGHFEEIIEFNRRIVQAEGYVDEQVPIDPGHVRLHMIIEDRPVICWVPPDATAGVPDWRGKVVRVQALYSGRLDPTGTQGTIELWVGRQSDVEVLTTIAADPRFDRPVTPIRRISGSPPGTGILLRGHLMSREPGLSMVVRDGGGQIEVRTRQRERIPNGTMIEAIGRTAVEGSRWILDAGLVRRAPVGAEPGEMEESANGHLRYVDQIRALSPAELAEGRAVEITGLVTWSLPDVDHFFLEDVTGGVKVRFDLGAMSAPFLQKALRVTGVTRVERGVPVVHSSGLHDLGSMAHAPPRRIRFDRARTGAEDGQWVMLRGFLHKIESDGDWRSIHVTTSDGEFVARLLSPENLVAAIGSLIRVQGVCETEVDESGQRGRVVLQVPFLHDITIEEDAPDDLFALPERTLVSLARMGTEGDLQRVRVRGVVVQHAPGAWLALQEDGAGLKVFTSSRETWQPGDVVDAVGVLGRHGARTVLREASCRRVGTGEAPEPLVLDDLESLHPERDQRLVRVRARVLGALTRSDGALYTVQAGNTVFEAQWVRRSDAERVPAAMEVGATVELTGLYWIDYDDFNQPQRFDILLRSAADAVLVVAPDFWTVGRALAVAAVLAGCSLLVVLWVVALRQRVARQTAQIKAQIETQARLEAELERGQRLRSLGVLAGGIAHDFNNLLTVILGNLTLAKLEPHVMDLAGEYIEEAEIGTTKARDLTQQLITFARGGAPICEPVDLAGLVREVGTLTMSGAAARLDFRCPPDLAPVQADRGQLSRALQNLLIHARTQALSGGVISVSAANETITAAGQLPLPPGRYVLLTIKDHGPGVSPARLADFFDPYASSLFTDDRFALAIVYSIIKRHDGHIEVNSGGDDGIVFYLWLPASDGTPAPPEDAPTALPEGLDGLRVLVMDDDEHIRTLSERLLRKMRCEAHVVDEGSACVQAYLEAKESGRPFDVVILDLTVPGGMGGQEAITALLAIDPGVRAIVSSGYSNDPVLAEFRKYGFTAGVPKPFGVEVLADAIRKVVDPARLRKPAGG